MQEDPGIHIGTSGWHYRHWIGPLYPPGTVGRDFLAHYGRHFSTVEINATFYRLPKIADVHHWRDSVPAGFLFACKASRYVTHMKKLRDPTEASRRFFQVIEVLGDKLGPILFQLPPHWGADPPRLAAFVQALPRGHRYVFEFRDSSWFTPGIFEILNQANVALCLGHTSGLRTPKQATADFIYFRMHGPTAAHQSSYRRRVLAAWAARVMTWRKAGLEVFGYFNNDRGGCAVHDAQRLLSLLGEDPSMRNPTPAAAGPPQLTPR